jgi:hypothetical protein
MKESIGGSEEQGKGRKENWFRGMKERIGCREEQGKGGKEELV